MSRWGEMFAALSNSDTSDTTDTRSDKSKTAEACVATVNPGVPQASAALAAVIAAEILTKPEASGPSVTCVACVKDKNSTLRPGEKSPDPDPDTSATVATQDRQERAAIIEHDAGAPRAWAEGFARFDPDRPPSNVPPRRWRQFVDDIGQFLDGGFAKQAAALGWGPFDLFGCDRDRPFARIDKAGLLWLLNGARLVALTTDTALIENMPGGVRLTYRRRPAESGCVLAWELVP